MLAFASFTFPQRQPKRADCARSLSATLGLRTMTTTAKIGRYEVVQEKGHGAMGAVYLARDPAMDRIVALKTIHSVALSGPQSKEYRERFYGEARAAGRLAHPGIVPVFDVGEQDGSPFLVMEYIEGQTLAEAAKSGHRLSLERVCELGQQIAEALGYAHKHGVVHRDIKPANILLTSQEKYGIERPKITDFGVAKFAASQLTTTGQLLGTPAFMPPEQFTGAVIDGRSDLFSLGVILYWLATGDQPFPGETITAVSYKVVHTEPVPPRRLNPSVSPELEQVILKCLAKDPAARYQTGEELAQHLAIIRTGRPTPGQPAAPTFGRGRKPGPPVGAMDVTLDSDPELATLLAVQKTAVSPPPVVPAAAIHTPWGLVGVAGATVLLAAGFFVYRSRTRPELTQTAATTIASPRPAANAAPGNPAVANSLPSAADTQPGEDIRAIAGSSTAAAGPAKALLAKKAPQPETKTNSAASEPAVTEIPPTLPAVPPPPALLEPAPTRVDFDPTTLKPNESARLRVEADHFPPSLGFTIEMDGKVYFERGVKPQTVFDNLYAPPGVHEFRVVAGLGASSKTSNIVSTDFRAKKKKTLRIELREKGAKPDGPTPQSIGVDSQLVLTLK
jgi:predicted Ser/Thr protein kinase